MCTVCGCGDAGHDHGHGHHHHHFGHGPAGTAVAGMSQSRLVEIETSILAKNDAFAWENRAWLNRQGWFAVNVMSSPGSGKTSLLVATIGRMAGPVAVIEGDQQTQNDADRIRATGAPAVQINTGKGCHLDAHMVAHALMDLPQRPATTLFIENVGNLVCPAGFDLGEDARVVLFSVTEGEDKPLKYPEMFTNCDLAILTKTDLAPHCDVDLDLCEANLRRVNPRVAILRLSARTGEGMAGWTQWLADQATAKAKRLAAE